MKRLIVYVEPFNITQKIYVYEDNKELARYYPTFDELSDTIASVAEKFGAKQVDIAGSMQFNMHIGEELLTKYAQLQVNYI